MPMIEVPDIAEDSNDIIVQCAACSKMTTIQYVGDKAQSSWDRWEGKCMYCNASIDYVCPAIMIEQEKRSSSS